jgi:hypothetical protein
MGAPSVTAHETGETWTTRRCLECGAEHDVRESDGRVRSTAIDLILEHPCGHVPDDTVQLTEGHRGPMGYWPPKTKAWPVRDRAGNTLLLLRIPHGEKVTQEEGA